MSVAGIIVAPYEFTAPGPENFDLPGVFSVAGHEITKPMLLASVLVFGFLYLAARQRKWVPGRLQFAG